MELEKFLEKFLPDYQKKIEDYLDVTDIKHVTNHWLLWDFYDKYFQEALQNFADRICEAQRVNCHDRFARTDGYIPCYNVLRAAQPKIEEL